MPRSSASIAITNAMKDAQSPRLPIDSGAMSSRLSPGGIAVRANVVNQESFRGICRKSRHMLLARGPSRARSTHGMAQLPPLALLLAGRQGRRRVEGREQAAARAPDGERPDPRARARARREAVHEEGPQARADRDGQRGLRLRR